MLGCAAIAAAMLGSVGCGGGSSAPHAGDNQRHFASTQTAEQHADEHRAAAPALRSFEDGACRDIAPEIRAECPLLGNVVSADDFEDGIILHLSLHMHPGEVIQRARCHMAFGHAHDHGDNSKCPLYVPSVGLRHADEQRSLELYVRDPDELEELWRRVHDHAGW